MSEVLKALQQLATVHGPKALADAFATVRRAVWRRRQQEDAELGPLAQTYLAAIRIWDQQKADGVSEAERVAGLEKTLRVAWPQQREWKYFCERCSDTGWEFRTCTAADPCGRPFRLPAVRSDDQTGQGHCTEGHSYVLPCWCKKGSAIKRQLLKQPDPNIDHTTAGAGSRKMTRVGR